MKALLVLLAPLMILSAQSAIAMPCDVSAKAIKCASASGNYKFYVVMCGFDSTVRSSQLKIAGLDTDASVSNSWDGGLFSAFELNLSGTSDNERKVTIEYNRKNGKGHLEDSHRDGNPAPWHSTKSEAIKCVESDAR